jgi:uncharacterized protein YdhG (YjbR/CyaY superfamily)
METNPSNPTSIDQYIAGFEPKVQSILKKIRRTIRSAAPQAQETISYNMPAFRQNGVLVYFAAFKNHIGFYPPVSGNKAVEKAARPFKGAKGSLRFPYDQPIPYDLLKMIVKLRVKQNQLKAPTRADKGRTAGADKGSGVA